MSDTQAKLRFQYSDAPQRSPEWLDIKRGKIGASSLWRWLSVSKAKATMGKPLKGRLDYEKELLFERQFNASFQIWVNSAMQEGIDFEDWAANQYAKIKNVKLLEVGCFYNDYFAASPDRKIVGVAGGIEVKILKDNSFTEVLMSGVPEKHWQQIQGQLWAAKWDYVDYVAANFNTKKVVIIRVEPDPEFHEYLELSVQEKLVTEPFTLDNVYDILGGLPEGSDGLGGAQIDRSDSNISNNDWSN
ncbi:MAG: YqaJ viral recombinase family protein [Candidatus Saccharimonadales bacterium]